MSQFLILDNNLAFRTTAGVSATSEDASFPAANIQKYQRARKWHSSGYFVLDSSNNAIDFVEVSMGSEVSVTVAAGEYTPSELATAIGDAMTAGSGNASTYTCTYLTGSGTWRIATDGSYLDLLFATGTNVANTIASTIGFAASDRTGAVTYTGPNVAIHTLERIVVDLLTPDDNVDTLIFARNSDTSFTSSATITFKANATNSGWDSASVSQSVTLDDSSDYSVHHFSSDQNYRYWAIEIVDPENPNLYVEVPKFMLGKATDLSRGPEIGFTWSYADQSNNQETPGLQRYSDILPTRQTFQFALNLLTYAQYITIRDIFLRVGSVQPIAIILDYDETFFDREQFTLYGYLNGTFSPAHQFRDEFNSGDLLLEEAF